MDSAGPPALDSPPERTGSAGPPGGGLPAALSALVARPADAEPARSRHILQVVIDSFPQRVFWKDRESRFLGCNRAFARDAGLEDPAQIVGRTDFDFPWRASAHLYRADDSAVMESNLPKVDIDEPMQFPDGRTIWLRTNKVPLRDESGAVFGVLGTYEDVTDRRQAALDLAESEERFRATFEQAAVGLAHVATDGRWLRVNRRLCEMVGYARAELVGLEFQDITHPDDVAADLVAMRRMIDGEIESDRFEKRYVRKDGAVAWIELTVSLLREPDGQPKYFICVVEDIEPRRRADAERRKLAEIVEQSTEAVVMTDVDGAITYVNPAFERVSGWARNELEGRNPRILSSGRQSREVYDELWSTIAQGKVWSGHLVNRRRDGTLFEEDATIFPVRDLAGQIRHYVGIKRDVTQEVKLREQLHQVQKMESIGQLAGGIAHDFNNLLTAILGFADVVLADERTPHRPAVLQIRHAGERAAALTRQLLAFGRKQILRPEVLDLGAVLAEMEPMLRRLLAEDVILRVGGPPEPAFVRADASQIEQVVLNLAVNARDSMPRGGSLRIEAARIDVDETTAAANAGARPGAHAVLTVSDTGCGMDAETLRRAFEPFFTTKEKGKGTGLGLATVYGIVQQSGGFVTVESEPDAGTTFRVHLPLVERAPGAAAGAPNESADPAPGSETILLVEDDAGVRQFAQCVLESSGYRVLCAESGAAALDLVRADPAPVHLVITDVVMPGMSGRDLRDRLIALGRAPRVLFISGYTDDVIARHGILEDGILFLQKPFSPAVLTRKVRELLEMRAT